MDSCLGNVEILPYQSEIYDDAEIQSAIDTVIRYFETEFSGCTLTQIEYAGDASVADYAEFARRHEAEDVIVFSSSFDVDASGGDGSLQPNQTYTGWKWILVRGDNGRWIHADHGY